MYCSRGLTASYSNGGWPPPGRSVQATIYGTEKQPGWEFISIGRIGDSSPNCNTVRQFDARYAVKEGLDNVRQAAEAKLDYRSRVLKEAVSIEVTIQWSRCVVDLKLTPILISPGTSMLDAGFVADAFRTLSVRITTNGAANLGMDMWEWIPGWYKSTRIGFLEIKIREPSVQ